MSMNLEAQRKNIFVKCISCGHPNRYHFKDKLGNNHCEKV